MFFSSLILVVLSSPVQQARFAGGELERAKPRLFGTDGTMIPEEGALGPFGDMDGDGDVDLVGDTGTYANDGRGVFRLVRKLAFASDEPRLALHDADGDGALDLLTRTHLYHGDGAGGFADASSALPPGARFDVVTIADIDGDSDADIVAIRRQTYPDPALLEVHVNDGSGSFATTSSVAAAFATTLATGDIDGDADSDLILAGSSSELWKNDGSGLFASTPAGLGAVEGEAVALPDVDLDGDLDLVVGGTFYSAGRMFLNDGSGSFSEVAFPAVEGAVRSLAVLDREGDGDPDLVLGLGTTDVYYGFPVGNRLLENVGGAYTVSGALPKVLSDGLPVFTGDLDGDGDADLVFQGGPSGFAGRFQPARVHLNDGSGTFVPVRGAEKVLLATDPNRLAPRVVALGDLDGDALPDVFTPQRVLVNGPPGVLTPLAPSLPGLPLDCHPFSPSPVTDVALGDVDGDGDLDAYLAIGMNECGCFPCQYNALWTNDGAGGFTDESATRLPVGASEVTGIPQQAELLDLDGDGDLDAACVRIDDNDGSGASSCYLNDGTGVFTLKEALGHVSRAGGFGDFDADGDTDYLEGATFSSGTTLYLNDGTAHFVASPGAVPPRTLVEALFLVVGDTDGDGDLDAHVSLTDYYTSGPVAPSLYVNDGTGHFSEERLPLTLALDARGESIDLDLDGDRDLVTSREILLNDGTGHFELHTGRATPWNLRGSAGFGDLDLDGDVDAIFADREVVPVLNLARHVRARGGPRLGKRFELEVHGPAWTPYVLRQSLGTGFVSLGSAGYDLLDPAQVVRTVGGGLDQAGEAVVRTLVPNSPALLGQTSYWQALVGVPAHATNLTVTTITGL
jgi:hypothetical protein